VALGGLALVALIWAAVGSDIGPAPVATTPAAGAGGAPDISNLTPRQQFGRLAERIETAMEAGDTSTVVGFFPMVEAAFANLSDGDRDIDARLHLSLLRARVGHASTAVAQVDTIVAEAPNHLFADYLRAIIADFENDSEAAAAARQAFRRHYPAEIATTRPEYLVHRQMLDQFLATIPDPRAP
jgi:hypothetical protein